MSDCPHLSGWRNWISHAPSLPTVTPFAMMSIVAASSSPISFESTARMRGSIPLPIDTHTYTHTTHGSAGKAEGVPRGGKTTYRRTVPGHDDNRHAIVSAPMKKVGETRIKPAFCGSPKRDQPRTSVLPSSKDIEPSYKGKDRPFVNISIHCANVSFDVSRMLFSSS